MKKILIIEDQQEDFDLVTTALGRYAVEVYPRLEDFRRFTRILGQYASNAEKDPTLFIEKIRKEASDFKPDFIFIDLGLDGNRDSSDNSGLRLRDQLFTPEFPEADVYLMSGKSGEAISRSNYLYKRATGTFEAEVLKKFVMPHQIPLVAENTSADTVNPQILPAGSQQQKLPSDVEQTLQEKAEIVTEKHHEKEILICTEDPLLQEITMPKWLGKFKRQKEHRWTEIIRTIIDMLIMGVFYALIFALTFVGPYVMYVAAVKDKLDPLHLAESGFIAFLPLLVVFGFFAFYRRSLQPLLNGSSLDSVDYNRASELMTLSKKLFISSLISYLFTNLIEMLFLNHLEEANKTEWRNNFFNEYFRTSNNPLIQVYMIASAIVVLIIFYIYLNSHKPSGHGK